MVDLDVQCYSQWFLNWCCTSLTITAFSSICRLQWCLLRTCLEHLTNLRNNSPTMVWCFEWQTSTSKIWQKALPHLGCYCNEYLIDRICISQGWGSSCCQTPQWIRIGRHNTHCIDGNINILVPNAQHLGTAITSCQQNFHHWELSDRWTNFSKCLGKSYARYW